MTNTKFYVLYLGWKVCRASGGRQSTEPKVKQLVAEVKGLDSLARLTLKVFTVYHKTGGYIISILMT